jgi:hypothetical protein
MTLTKLIGNEPKQEETLLERAIENSLIKKVLERKIHEPKNEEQKKYFKKGMNLFDHLLRIFPIEMKEPNLEEQKYGSDYIPLASRSLYAINNILLANKSIAKLTLDEIDLQYNYESKTGLIRNEKNSIFTLDNSLLAIAYFLIEEDNYIKKASGLVESIDKNIGYNTKEHYPGDMAGYIMAKKGLNNPVIVSEDTFAFSIAAYLSGDDKKAERLNISYKEIVDYGDNSKMKHYPLVRNYKEKETIQSFPNLLHIISDYLLFTNDDLFNHIFWSLERKIGFVKHTDEKYRNKIELISSSSSNSSTFCTDNLALVFAYLTLGGALDKYKKK